MRDITGGMSTALQGATIRPVLIGRLDIKDDPVTAWTGPGIFAPTSTGDVALDGQTFDPLGAFVDVTNVAEDQGMGQPVVLKLTAHDLDDVALRQIIRDKRQWRGRRAWLWLGLIDADNKTVVSDPVRIKTGLMTKIIVKRDKTGASIDVTIDVDAANARQAAFRLVDHVRYFPGDQFSNFIVKLANKPQGFGTDVELRRLSEFDPGDIGNPEANKPFDLY